MNKTDRLDIAATNGRLRKGTLSPHALLDQHLKVIGRLEPDLNCFITLDEAGAKAAADASGARYRAGNPLSLLDGIPIAFKDNMDVAGLPTSNGTARLNIADQDADAVGRLRAAGAVILGKLNMDECALGAVTNNAHHGATQNSWRPGYTSGGSSGGCAAAVAAGLVMAALGTDTLGSVRLPAAYSGITGLKPTRGLISLHGVAPLSHSYDHVGPITGSVRDAEILLHIHTGEVLNAAPASRPNLQGLRIGFLEGAAANLSGDVAAGFEKAREAMASLGATLVALAPLIADLRELRRQTYLVAEAEAAGRWRINWRIPRRIFPVP